MKGLATAARKPNYYLAGAIRGDNSYVKYQHFIREVVGRYGEPYTERSEWYAPLDPFIEEGVPVKEKKVFERDMMWLRQSRAVIAEVSGQSTGTGAEIIMGLGMWKPTLCLYHQSSLPSLIIKQYTHTHRHLIVQEYAGEQDLERYLTCFMKLVSISDDMNEIRRNYLTLSREAAQSNLQIAAICERAQSLLNASRQFEAIDFKNLKDFKTLDSFATFMFRNIVLQTRWDRLSSQRIGDTLVSGDKWRIVTQVVQYALDNLRNVALGDEKSVVAGTKSYDFTHRYVTIDLGRIYQNLRKERLRYSRWAFTKNLRAYRRIGLLLPSGEIRYGGSKFKDQVQIIEAFEGRKLVSSSSRRSMMNPKIRVTNHFYPLMAFLGRYGQQALITFLMECREVHWYSKIANALRAAPLDIDQIHINDILHYDWGPEVSDYLNEQCWLMWTEKYSSFLGRDLGTTTTGLSH